MIGIGVLIIIASIILFTLIVFFVYPKMFLKFKYSRILSEGIKSENNTYYIPDNLSQEAIEKYELIKDVKKGKKYAVITLKEHVDLISLAIYSFDYQQRAFDFMIVDYLEASNKIIVEVKSKTFGLNIQVVSYNQNKLVNINNEKKLRLFRTDLIAYSIFVGFSTLVFAFLFTLGISFCTVNRIADIFYLYAEVLNIGMIILLGLLTFFVSGIASYFIVLLRNREYFTED